MKPRMTRPDSAPNPGSDDQSSVSQNVNPSINSVAENVTSFLSGIRASFRSENVMVTTLSQSKKGNRVDVIEEK